MKIVLAHIFNEGKEVSILIEDKDGTVVTQIDATAAELIALKRRQGSKKNRQSKSAGRKFSRFVSLVRRCVRTGRWTTGAVYPADQAVAKLCTTYWMLQAFERADVTSNAIVGLRDIYGRTTNGAVADVITDILNHKGGK